MSDSAATTAAAAAAEPSLTRNVLSNWFSQVALMASGFIVPRLISDFAGRTELGIWDLGWSLVSFCLLLSLGVEGAVTRYVAHYGSRGDYVGMSRIVSSCAVLLTVSGGLTMGLSALFISFLPGLLESSDPETIALARQVIWVLGFTAAVQLPSSVFNGVLCGCGEFTLRNMIRVGVSLAVLSGIATTLWFGRGMLVVAGVVVAGAALTGLLYYIGARRRCPLMKIGLRYVTRQAIGEAMAFGGKSLVRDAARSGLYEGNKVILTYFLTGPSALGALAVYSRQRSLVMIAYRFMVQYAHVFIPASSALHARQDHNGLVALFYKATSVSFFIVLPAVAVLAILGNPLMRLWMGPGYEQPLVLIILALGHAASLANEPTIAILTGMNRHGIAAVAEAFSTITSLALGFLFVGALKWKMPGAALAVALPVTLFGGVVVPVLACRVLAISPPAFLWQTVRWPLAMVSPFALWLFLCTRLFPTSDALQLLLGLGVGALILLPFYWQRVVPVWVKRRIARAVNARLRLWRAP